MNAHKLNADARRKLSRRLTLCRAEISKIRQRMKELGWYTDDVVLINVEIAEMALRAAQIACPKPGDPVVADKGIRIPYTG